MKKLVGPALLVLASVCFSIAVFEVALRALGWAEPVWYQPDARLGWRMRPGLTAWFTQEGRGFVRVNAEGMRDRDHLPDKPAGVYRIAVLGDSYAEARQVEREQAFWALLPGELAACGFQSGKQIEVLNFGISGYGTAQEYLMLESTAIRYQPDLVLLQFTNGNDVRNNSFALEPEKERPFFMLGADGALRIDESYASSQGFRARSSFRSELVRKATDRSRVLQLARFMKEHSFFPKAHAGGGALEQGLEPAVLAAPRDALWEDAWRVTEGLIAKTGEFAQRNGARFVVVTAPYAIQVHPDPKQRAALQEKLGVADLFYPDRRVAGFAEKRGLLAVPLAPEMQPLAEKGGAYFHGFDAASQGRGHWNAAGHKAAAAIIARRLCAAGT